MFTIIGKSLVFVIVALSLAGLGMSVWAAVDKRDWKKEREDILDEIAKRQYTMHLQRSSLIVLLDEINKGDRKMPWDPQTGATPESVNKTKQQIRDLTKTINERFDQHSKLAVAHGELITQLAKERQDYVTAVAEHKTLRETIKPETPNTKGFRELAADQRTAKEAAEVEQENIRPNVVNELVRVAQVKARLDELTARLKELQGAAGK
jgi:hypothetical protein